MSLPSMMPIEELFAYDPSRSGQATTHNEAEVSCARAIVEQELSLRLDQSTMPKELNALLNDAWKEVLAAIYMDDGYGSIRWILAMEITDELIWTLQPKQNLAERTKMISMLPTLVKVLRQGLASVHWERDQTEKLFSTLSRYHMTVLRGAPSTPAKPQKPVGEAEAAKHSMDLLEGVELDGLPLEKAEGEKGWVFRPDTNEWVYQGESVQKVGHRGATSAKGSVQSSASGRVRKMGRGDH